jgi:hypothetical protein
MEPIADLVDARCTYCHRPMETVPGVGRPRRYCRRSCRQRAFERRRRDRELAWGEDRVVELLQRHEELSDRVAMVEDVLEELRQDLGDGLEPSAHEVIARVESALRSG